MGELLKRGYWSNWWMELGGKEKDKWQHPQTLPKLGGNFPIFGVMIPQESGIRAGGSLNDN